MAELPPAEIAAFFTHLATALGDRELACPVCAGKAWEAREIVAAPVYTEDASGQARTGSSAFPFVPLICRRYRQHTGGTWGDHTRDTRFARKFQVQGYGVSQMPDVHREVAEMMTTAENTDTTVDPTVDHYSRSAPWHCAQCAAQYWRGGKKLPTKESHAAITSEGHALAAIKAVAAWLASEHAREAHSAEDTAREFCDFLLNAAEARGDDGCKLCGA